ncbi:MAG TPA: GDP-mannose 4,6-dehydratase [Solirubrobacteraceae bacterium]|nr:GDP-mannose 4,6-dehydratase [Solirubrobacteraceae bacterium]
MSRGDAEAPSGAPASGVPAARTALVTGITGQDGSFLAELLLEKGYEVVGVVRAAERAGGTQDAELTGAARDPQLAGATQVQAPLGCSEHLRSRIGLVHGDLLAPDTLRAAIERVRPHELYHLAAPSFVPASWERPQETIRAIAGSAAAILEAVRDLAPATRVFVSASGAIFGETPASPQREDTPCRPSTPYAVAKLAAHQLVGLLRARDGLHASSGIVFNHESERRPERFVTRRITRGAAAISLGLQQELTLGDLHAVRDWSFAGDVVRGAWLMLQQERPDDYVLASGSPHTVAELAHAAFACVGLQAERHVRVDPALLRPPEATPSVGDPGKARECLGWAPEVGFRELVERMVQADLRELRGVADRP